MFGVWWQIFVVFVGFMMVEKFGFIVSDIICLFMFMLLVNMIVAFFLGRLVQVFGEWRAMIIEYVGLMGVFFAYGGFYYFGWGIVLVMGLYIINYIFFSFVLVMKIYFQKIADFVDIVPMAVVAFIINHIAVVFLPVLLGYVWLILLAYVFMLVVGMALVLLGLLLLISCYLVLGYEIVFQNRLLAVVE